MFRPALALPLAGFLLNLTACGGSSPASQSPATTVTFNKDIAPIVFANCASCHRPGEVAPFPLLSYSDTVKHAEEIGEETLARHMPPWLPERGEFPVLGDRRLSDAQIQLIQQWIKNGTPEGNAADLPKVPSFAAGWQLGTPDQIVTLAKPYKVTPGTEDVYRNLVMRTGLTAGKFVRAVEFKTNGAPIHHAVIRVDPTPASRRRDGQDGQPGFDGMGFQNAQDPGGQFIGWAPGRGPILAPDGIPWRLDDGADLVVELHLIPSDQPLVIQPTVGLFFTDKAPQKSPVTVKMGSKLIDIPAGARDHVVTDTYDLVVPVDLMSVYPHAHYLGKDMRLTARFPNGPEKLLLHIKQWNFHWQQDYRYTAPIALPAGTRLTMRYTFDNSEGNHDNPHKPPVRVKLGPKSTDEMAELGLQVMPQSLADAAKLVQSFDDRDAQKNVEMGELRVRDEPNNAEYRAFLGSSYLEVGRHLDAIPHLEAAIRLDPKSAAAHNDLGMVFLAQDRLSDALASFQRATSLAPKNEVMQFNLGNVLNKMSRPTEAAAAYSRALAINPEFPDAHVNMGALLFSRGRVRDALPFFARAAQLQPNSAVIHTDFSSVLAAAGRFPEAMQHVRRALELRPDYAPAQENFRRLQQMGVR
jgi:Flp pilus assembly protein TadD/mono/diheme cytochrome c family protein